MIKQIKKFWHKISRIPEEMSKKEKQINIILKTRQHELGEIIKDIDEFQKFNNYNVTMTHDSIREISIRLLVENNTKWDNIVPEIRRILMHVNKSQNHAN